MTTIEHVEGTLTNESGDMWKIRLALTVAQLSGALGIEDTNVSRVELISDVPDGDYTLEYNYLRPIYQRVRVKRGRLEGASAV